MNKLTQLTTQKLIEAGCYRLPVNTDDDCQLLAFNISGWNLYSVPNEPILLLETPIGSTLGYCFGDDVEADIARLKGIIRKCKREYEAAHPPQYEQLALF